MHQVVERPEGLFDFRLGIGLVDEEQIEPFGPETLQAGFDLTDQVAPG